jgi:D-glutamate cyclase
LSSSPPPQPGFGVKDQAPAAELAAEFEQIVHCDPGCRGLAAYRVDEKPLDAGQLEFAAAHLADHAKSVGIATGFCAQTPSGIAAETDGPPGALYLGRALVALGIEVTFVADRITATLLRTGCQLWDLVIPVLEFPTPKQIVAKANAQEAPAAVDGWIHECFATGPASRWTHLIAIECPGPSHTLASLQAQQRATAPPVESFMAQVAEADRDVCHNMRGQSIASFTAPMHRLFEQAARGARPITTIGIGDGGNEIGMGRFLWEDIVAAVGTEPAARIACRVAADFAILGGVSNWAAYALALLVAMDRGRVDLARDWNEQRERALIEHLVRSGAIDGRTLKREATVDGMPLDAYLSPLTAMRSLLGF